MNRSELIRKVRSMTRDLSASVFTEIDIIDWINESINRFKQVIPELKDEIYLLSRDSKPKLIPYEFQHLIAVYTSSRCFSQDERHYQATTLMNEFEVKLEELRVLIENGDLSIINPDTGEEIHADLNIDYVDLYPYWGIKSKKNGGFEGVN